MRTNRRFSLSIAAVSVAVAATACTDSPDPVSPRQASLPSRPSLVNFPVSNSIEYTNGVGKLDVTNVQIEFPEGFVAGGPIIVTGNYELKSLPDCDGCTWNAYIGVLDETQVPEGVPANSSWSKPMVQPFPSAGSSRGRANFEKPSASS